MADESAAEPGPRQSTWLGPPSDGDVTEDFPALIIPEQCVRAHSSDYGPYWFATIDSLNSPLGGRFDLVSEFSAFPDGGIEDDSIYGTLYCSNDVEAAVRERLGPAFAGRRYIAASDLHDTSVSILYMEESSLGRCLANTVEASGFLTREISTMSSYDVTRAWAAEFFRHGFDGLAYEPRSTPGAHRAAYAVFGPAGVNEDLNWSPHPSWWQEMVDTGVVLASVSTRSATIIE